LFPVVPRDEDYRKRIPVPRQVHKIMAFRIEIGEEKAFTMRVHPVPCRCVPKNVNEARKVEHDIKLNRIKKRL
jgi:hypothetical protein